MLIDLEAEDVRTIRVFLPMALIHYRFGGSVHAEINQVLKKLPDVETRIGIPSAFLDTVTPSEH